MSDFEKLKIKNWSIEDVCFWVTTINLPNLTTIPLVQSKMRENEINGAVLLTYNIDSLMQDGFTRGAAVTIFNAIEELKNKSCQESKKDLTHPTHSEKKAKRNSVKSRSLPTVNEEQQTTTGENKQPEENPTIPKEPNLSDSSTRISYSFYLLFCFFKHHLI